MLIRELITESISLSKYHPKLRSDILNLVKSKGDIISYLTSTMNDIAGTSVPVKVKSLPKGDGSFVHDDNTLYINDKVMNAITTAKNKELLIDAVNRLISVYLHEITHVIQLSKSGKPYERSLVYNKPVVDKVITKLGLGTKKERENYTGDKEDLNLKKLNVYLARLGDPNSEINMVVDRAQPEEIAAYANQSASEIISSISADDRTNIRAELRFALKQLKNSKNNLTKSVKDYKIVNKHSKQAHDKFFKLLYLNLVDYYDSLR